jgi:dienelactone hydrolase
LSRQEHVNLRICLAALALVFTSLLAAPVARAHTEFEVQETYINARIDGRLFRLEAVITKAKSATGKLPVALFLHGKDFLGSAMADTRPSSSNAQARDLAERGWLSVSFTRRGFGRSDGPFPAIAGCDGLKLEDQFVSDAGEALAVMEALKQRPDADTDRVIAIGVSAGGATAVALAARNPPGLKGIVNISGGLSLSSCQDKANVALAAAFGSLAGRSKVPQLWVYADNDELFPAALVNQMHEAALKANSDVRRFSIPKLEPRGHNVYGNSTGRRLWLRETDNSLRAWKLPTYNPADVVPWLKAMGLTDRDRNSFERYLFDPGYKAMAFSAKDKRTFWRFGGNTAKDVNEGALKDCSEKFQDCRLVLEGIDLKQP